MGCSVGRPPPRRMRAARGSCTVGPQRPGVPLPSPIGSYKSGVCIFWDIFVYWLKVLYWYRGSLRIAVSQRRVHPKCLTENRSRDLLCKWQAHKPHIYVTPQFFFHLCFYRQLGTNIKYQTWDMGQHLKEWKFFKSKWNIAETDSKQPKIHRKIHTSLWILKISRKKICDPQVSSLLPNFCDFQTKIHTLP
jgi:hypothetical protein